LRWAVVGPHQRSGFGEALGGKRQEATRVRKDDPHSAIAIEHAA